jgi:lysylphosphatidylglycerol synthetase-like protein (DUF2156 family)
MTSMEKSGKHLWVAGMVVLPLAVPCELWYQRHAQNYAQASAAFIHLVVFALVWAFWSLTGLIWMQKFNEGRMAKN